MHWKLRLLWDNFLRSIYFCFQQFCNCQAANKNILRQTFTFFFRFSMLATREPFDNSKLSTVQCDATGMRVSFWVPGSFVRNEFRWKWEELSESWPKASHWNDKSEAFSIVFNLNWMSLGTFSLKYCRTINSVKMKLKYSSRVCRMPFTHEVYHWR